MTSPASFRTDRILAEKLNAGDIDDIHRMHQDSAVMEHLGGRRSWVETLKYVNENMSHWNKHGYGLWILRGVQTKVFMGRGVLRAAHIEGQEEVELGFALLKEHWGQGLASEFAAMAVEVAFSKLGMKELVALATPGNHASIRVIEKIGGLYERDVMHKDALCNLYKVKAGCG